MEEEEEEKKDKDEDEKENEWSTKKQSGAENLTAFF